MVVSYFAIVSVQTNGWMDQNLPLVNTSMWPNAIGFAVFAFEGVGIVLPVQDMTADKDQYFKVVCFTVCSIAALYIGFSELCLYAWYGRFNPNMPLITEYLPRDNFFC